jgi:pumilio homology domain family member 6
LSFTSSIERLLDLCFSDKTTAIETLLKLLSSPYPSPDPAHPHPIDLSHMSRMYKTLLQGGHYDHSSKKISRSSTFSASSFASSFLRIVGEELTVAFAKGGGAFVVAELCETIRKEGGEAEMATVRSWFDDDARTQIDQGDTKGRDVLLKNLDALGSQRRE